MEPDALAAFDEQTSMIGSISEAININTAQLVTLERMVATVAAALGICLSHVVELEQRVTDDDIDVTDVTDVIVDMNDARDLMVAAQDLLDPNGTDDNQPEGEPE